MDICLKENNELPIEFPTFKEHGVSLKYSIANDYLLITDAKDPEKICGYTKLDRHPAHLDKLLTISDYLTQKNDSSISILFGGCSIGLEPLSFARRAFETKAQDKVKIHALDSNAAYLACMAERKLPYKGVEPLIGIFATAENKNAWKPFIREIEKNKIYAISDELYDMVHVKEAQSILKHKKIYDIVNAFHIIEHLTTEQQITMLTHLCAIASSIVTIDYASGTRFAKDTSDKKEPEEKLNAFMNEKGFQVLKARPVLDKKHHAYKSTDESFIFCRKELFLEIETIFDPK